MIENEAEIENNELNLKKDARKGNRSKTPKKKSPKKKHKKDKKIELTHVEEFQIVSSNMNEQKQNSEQKVSDLQNEAEPIITTENAELNNIETNNDLQIEGNIENVEKNDQILDSKGGSKDIEIVTEPIDNLCTESQNDNEIEHLTESVIFFIYIPFIFNFKRKITLTKTKTKKYTLTQKKLIITQIYNNLKPIINLKY